MGFGDTETADGLLLLDGVVPEAVGGVVGGKRSHQRAAEGGVPDQGGEWESEAGTGGGHLENQHGIHRELEATGLGDPQHLMAASADAAQQAQGLRLRGGGGVDSGGQETSAEGVAETMHIKPARCR